MKIGSLIECINVDNLKMYAKPVTLKEIYTIRDIFIGTSENGLVPLIRVEEIINDVNPVTGREYGYAVRRFREIQPPMEIKLSDFITELEPA